ncbi:MAG TPA: AraC family transcriptional regulator [Gemmatimonadaceae bacterium]
MSLPPLEAITTVARIGLPGGSFDALSADRFAMRYPPHFHDTWAIGVIEAGLVRLRTARGAWVGSAGTILAFAPGEIHSAEALSDAGYAYRMIYPESGFLAASGIERGAGSETAFRVPVFTDHELAGRLVKAHQPLMHGAWGPAAESRLIATLAALWRRHQGAGETTVPRDNDDLRAVARARDYLTTRFVGQVRLAQIAAECGLSSFQLIRVFQRVLGVSPYAYVVQLRVNKARELLHQGMGVSEVAYSCGFSDQSHLTRVFKKAIGVPPGAYQRGVRDRAA